MIDEKKVIESVNLITVKEAGHEIEKIDIGDLPHDGRRYFTKVPDEYYGEKMLFPLWGARTNTWEAMDILKIQCEDFRNNMMRQCPYTHWDYFSAVPLFVFSENVSFWLDRFKCFNREMYEDREWMMHHNTPDKSEGFGLTKVQEFMLGSGYTYCHMNQDGHSNLLDALVYLSNGDSIGFKVRMWFNK